MEIEEKYREACSFLESLSKLESPFSYMKDRKSDDLNVYLARMQELLDKLDNPEKNMKFIHVTGTSGKGTTVSLIHKMLQNTGRVVGSTSSPATTTTIERIRVNDLYIDPRDFIRIVDILKPIIMDMYLHSSYGKPSYFDILFAASLIYFKEQKCDYVVLEVGMGGRYDSTNIIKDPIITVITNIGIDHTHLLGDSLSQIAHEKAGIIKQGSHFFTTETNREIVTLFKNECSTKGASFHGVDIIDDPNVSLVRAIGRFLGIEDENVMEKVHLPCRFETVHKRPLIILDGAHNVSKVKFSLKKIDKMTYNKLYVIFGSGKTKDAFAMLDLISEYAKDITFTFTRSFKGKSFSLRVMIDYVSEKYPDIKTHMDFNPHAALINLKKNLGEKDVLLVIGSLYLAGDIRKIWYPEEFILQNRKSF